MPKSNYLSVQGESPTPSGRVSFPSVFEIDDRGKFSLMLIFDKEARDTDEFRAMVKSLNNAASEQFEVESYKDTFKGKPLKSPFKTSEHYEFLEEGEVAVRFKSKFRPQVIDADAETYLTDVEDFYPGCIARVTYAATAYDIDGSRGVSFNLNNIQKTGVGKRFVGSRKKAEDEFGAVAVDSSVQDMPGGDVDF